MFTGCSASLNLSIWSSFSKKVPNVSLDAVSMPELDTHAGLNTFIHPLQGAEDKCLEDFKQIPESLLDFTSESDHPYRYQTDE